MTTLLNRKLTIKFLPSDVMTQTKPGIFKARILIVKLGQINLKLTIHIRV